MYDECPRVSWKMGLIIEVYPSKDGHIRSVKVKTASGSLIRPVSRLYPLELECDFDNPAPAKECMIRTKRKAAIDAAQRIKSMSPDV